LARKRPPPSRVWLCLRPYPEYSPANSYPWSPFPPEAGPSRTRSSQCRQSWGWSGSAERPAHGGSTLHVQRFRGGLVFKAHRLCVSLNSRLGSNKEEEEGSALLAPRNRVAERACLTPFFGTFTWKPRPESGRDWLICSEFANLVLTVLYVPHSLDSGSEAAGAREGRAPCPSKVDEFVP